MAMMMRGHRSVLFEKPDRLMAPRVVFSAAAKKRSQKGKAMMCACVGVCRSWSEEKRMYRGISM
jgi:hypothetical protein